MYHTQNWVMIPITKKRGSGLECMQKPQKGLMTQNWFQLEIGLITT